MKLDIASVKEELADLKKKRDALDQKIQGLESYLGIGKSKNEVSKTEASSVRAITDMRPTVKEIYASNGNQPMRFKDLVDLVAQKHPEIVHPLIVKKLETVKRTILDNTEYGMYRLKTETPKSTDQGVG